MLAHSARYRRWFLAGGPSRYEVAPHPCAVIRGGASNSASATSFASTTPRYPILHPRDHRGSHVLHRLDRIARSSRLDRYFILSKRAPCDIYHNEGRGRRSPEGNVRNHPRPNDGESDLCGINCRVPFVQLTLAASLLFYGFDRSQVTLLGLVEANYVSGLVIPRSATPWSRVDALADITIQTTDARHPIKDAGC